ncbi:MAG: hypothetical protein HC880_20410 [Bacteroidia bacterium]|nr:hypothetical protein [Bacteroidia bacterium]
MTELSEEKLPKCPNCQELVRPNVYIFRDRSFVNTRIQAQKERFENFLDQHRHQNILVLEIGSGPTIKTIRSLTRRLARELRSLHSPNQPL